MQTIFRVAEASHYFDSMPTYEKRKERAQLVADKLKETFPEANIHVSNDPNEGDPEVIRMIEHELNVILNLLPE